MSAGPRTLPALAVTVARASAPSPGTRTTAVRGAVSVHVERADRDVLVEAGGSDLASRS
jgi:hypothetical protein